MQGTLDPSNSSGPVYNGTRSNGTVDKTAAQLATEKMEELRKLEAEKKRLYIEVPLMLSKISGVPSMLSTFAMLTVFTLILIKQPVILVDFYLYFYHSE